MSQFFESLDRTFEASAAVPLHAAVQIANTGKVSTNGLATRTIGFATRPAFASGDKITVRLLYPTYKAIAKEAFAIAATLYTEADGKVQDTAESTSLPMFLALEAATAENDVVEIMPLHYGGPAAS
jgi:hypothetical protein